MFERAYVISLDFRIDRRADFYGRLPKCLVEARPFRAIHGDTCTPPSWWSSGNGAWGCLRSHLAILETCINEGVGSYAVFEDDAHFVSDFESKLKAFTASLPDDWEQVYLGGQLMHVERHPPIKINQDCYRPYNVNRTHAFAVSRAGMIPLYHWLNEFPYVEHDHIDHHLGRWHEDNRNKVYCPPKWLVGQMGSSSNVSGKTEPVTFFDDPIDCAQSHQLLDDPICIVYRGDPALLRTVEAKSLLHCGNTLDSHGYDISLSQAYKLRDPLPELQRWYGWVRSEIIRNQTRQLPCMFHPRIETQWLQSIGLRTVEIKPQTLEQLNASILTLR